MVMMTLMLLHLMMVVVVRAMKAMIMKTGI
jgi:hypothetical protein